MTNKAQVEFESKQIGIRQIIEEIETIGFEAEYESQSNKTDIRQIVNQSLWNHFKKFGTSFILLLPILSLTLIIS